MVLIKGYFRKFRCYNPCAYFIEKSIKDKTGNQQEKNASVIG
jgi:hypothetical protein